MLWLCSLRPVLQNEYKRIYPGCSGIEWERWSSLPVVLGITRVTFPVIHHEYFPRLPHCWGKRQWRYMSSVSLSVTWRISGQGINKDGHTDEYLFTWYRGQITNWKINHNTMQLPVVLGITRVIFPVIHHEYFPRLSHCWGKRQWRYMSSVSLSVTWKISGQGINKDGHTDEYLFTWYRGQITNWKINHNTMQFWLYCGKMCGKFHNTRR